MFLTLTLPSYGTVHDGVPVDPDRYDYRRAALDALHFPKLVDRFWQNLRRCAGYKVQYFAAVEPQHRLAPHLHAAVRGAIPRATIRQVVRPPTPRCGGRPSTRPSTCTAPRCGPAPTTSTPTPAPPCPPGTTLSPAIPDDQPAHVMRFGTQLDMAGHHRPLSRRRPGRPLPHQIPGQVHRRHLHRRRRTQPGVRRARRPAAHRAPLAAVQRALRQLAPLRRPTQRRRPRHARRPVQLRKPTTGKTSASAAAASSSPGNGPARPSASTKPTGPPSSAKPCSTPASSPPRSNGSPPTVTLPDGRPRFVWTDTKTDPQTYARVILATVARTARWREPIRSRETGCAQPFGN